jgi:hypothetical protein
MSLLSRNHFNSNVAPYTIGALGAVSSLAGILDSVPDQIPKMWFWLAVWVIGILIPLLVGSYRNSIGGSATDDLLRQVLFEREVLRAGVLILQRDHLTDREIATLEAISSRMDEHGLLLSLEDRKKVVDCAFNIACADKDFRQGEQNAVREIMIKYNLDSDKAINDKLTSLANSNPGTPIKT